MKGSGSALDMPLVGAGAAWDPTVFRAGAAWYITIVNSVMTLEMTRRSAWDIIMKRAQTS